MPTCVVASRLPTAMQLVVIARCHCFHLIRPGKARLHLRATAASKVIVNRAALASALLVVFISHKENGAITRAVFFVLCCKPGSAPDADLLRVCAAHRLAGHAGEGFAEGGLVGQRAVAAPLARGTDFGAEALRGFRL